MMTLPKYKKGDIVELKGSRYSFRVDEILFLGPWMWEYRGCMFKDRRVYSYGVVTERALVGV